MIDVEAEVLRAEQRIRPHVRRTWVERSSHISQLSGASVTFKLENLQHTGSFKVRGAMNKLLALSGAERQRGVVAASTGNHGAAVAFCARRLGLPAIVFVPRNASPHKVEAIGRLGAQVRVHGHDPAETETHARAYADDERLCFVSPYNDPLIIGGQGTIGVELERQLERFDAVFVALGGGGLISGIAGYLKSVRPGICVVACSPQNSAVMMRSVEAGKILELPSAPTLSDGTAGGVEPGAITFDLCRQLVDEYVAVTEGEIAECLRVFMRSHAMLIEGAAAVAIAGLLRSCERFVDKEVVVVLCGANISPDTLKEVLAS